MHNLRKQSNNKHTFNDYADILRLGLKCRRPTCMRGAKGQQRHFIGFCITIGQWRCKMRFFKMVYLL